MIELTGTFEHQGAELRYLDTGGDGPSVLFTHGAGADHGMFDAQVTALSRMGHRVVVWDMRGHGTSGRGLSPFAAELALQDMRSLIEHLDLPRPVLAGHSLGGNLSQAMVASAPASFSGLVVMGSAWNAGPLTRTDRCWLRLSGPTLRMIPASKLSSVMARASAVTPAARVDAERAFATQSKPQFLEVWRATTALLQPDSTYRTSVPLCLIRGAEDSTGTISKMMPRWAAAEGVAEHAVPGAGHLVTQDGPEAVTAIIADFLAHVVAGD